MTMKVLSFTMKAFYTKNVFYPSLARLGTELLPPRMRMTVTRAIRKTLKFIEDFDVVYSENLKRCAKYNENGEMVYNNPVTHEVKIDNVEEWEKVLKEINELEFTLDEHILESDFPDTQFKNTDSNTLANLKDFIRESEEECCDEEKCNEDCGRHKHKQEIRYV